MVDVGKYTNPMDPLGSTSLLNGEKDVEKKW